MDYELSEREIEIIRLVATGASNKEIAQVLVISPNTVKVHLRNIFTKLEVASRTEATMVAIRQGWVNSPGNQNETNLDEKTEENDYPSSGESETRPELLQESNRNRRGVLILTGFAVIIVIVFYLLSVWRNQNTLVETTAVPGQTNLSESINRWEALSSIPQPLMGMAFSRYEQSFYLMGGKTNDGISDEVWIYDIDSDQWIKGQNIPHAVWNIKAAVLGEKIYVPGGMTEAETNTQILSVYDPRENQWERRADLPYPISDYCLTAFEGKLYLFGGWNGKGYSNQVLLYTPEDDEWTSFGEMPKAKGACSASVVGGKIHVFGGKNEVEIFNDHDLFVPQRYLQNEDPWETAAEMPEVRYGMESGVLADMIYVAGGLDGEGNSLDLIQYFPPKDLWVSIDQPKEAVGESPAVIPYETRLYTIGGLLDGNFSNSHQVYQAVYTILVPIVR
jgi:DNA-binding CsgD family transcriptional regulator